MQWKNNIIVEMQDRLGFYSCVASSASKQQDWSNLILSVQISKSVISLVLSDRVTFVCTCTPYCEPALNEC